MTYQEWKRAKAIKTWAHMYSVSVFEKSHPDIARIYEGREKAERRSQKSSNKTQGENGMFMNYQEWLRSYVGNKNSLDILNFERFYPDVAYSYKKRAESEREKREKIMAIKETEKRRKLIAENMKLFIQEKPCVYGKHTTAELQKRKEIMSVKDRELRRKLIAENIQLFEQEG